MTTITDRPLSDLDMHPRIHSALRRAGFEKVSSVLTCSSAELTRSTRLSQSDIHTLLLDVSRALLPSPLTTTALSLYESSQRMKDWGRLSTGCPALDSLLHGGLLVPGLTELAGISAAGKTQLCLQLCLTVQLPRSLGGLEGGAVYIATEDAFPHKRLQQMAEAFEKAHKDVRLSTRQLSDSIYVEHAATISALSMQIQYKLPALLSQGQVRLIVVDSIAALFRVEFSGSEASQRARLLKSFGAQLKRLGEQHTTAIVCINQVTAAMEGNSGCGVEPALGLAWADMVTVRLMAHRPEGVETEEECRTSSSPVMRTLEVSLAPHLPPSSIQYCIDSTGVHGDLKSLKTVEHAPNCVGTQHTRTRMSTGTH